MINAKGCIISFEGTQCSLSSTFSWHVFCDQVVLADEGINGKFWRCSRDLVFEILSSRMLDIMSLLEKYSFFHVIFR